MAVIKPFKGILYNQSVIDDLSKVVTPPYDVISGRMQEEFYRLHRNNAVRLVLGKMETSDDNLNNRYTRANKFLEDWLSQGVLIQDDGSSLYIYEQNYLFGGAMKSRLGFISLMKIEDPHKSQVLPHEYTFAKPKQDRLDLLKATNMNMSPIFSLFEDEDSSVLNIFKEKRSEGPIIDVEQDGVIHRIWRLSDPGIIRKIGNMMEKKQIFIADGHHRYEVSLSFRDWMRKNKNSSGEENPHDYIMVYFSDLDPEALTILSTHRVIRSIEALNFEDAVTKLKKYFKIQDCVDKDAMFSRMEKAKRCEFIFGMYYKDKGFISLNLKDEASLNDVITQGRSYEWKWLDVTILHQLVFDHVLKVEEKVAKRDNVVYTREADYAIKLVDEEGYQIAFFLNPPKVEQVRDVARSRDKMPHKTTYFYPKPLSGLLFYKMEGI